MSHRLMVSRGWEVNWRRRRLRFPQMMAALLPPAIISMVTECLPTSSFCAKPSKRHLVSPHAAEERVRRELLLERRPTVEECSG